jgi:transcriptional repressor NrdR
MNCPFCRNEDSRVVDSRPVEDGTAIRRRRECPQCGQRFSTQELSLLNIIKRSGATEPFSREKVLVGVRKACQGRPVNEDDLVLLAQRVEETLRRTGQAEIEAQEVGMAILAPLRELDEVAYLRYEGEIALLRALPSGNSPIASDSHSNKNSTEQSTNTSHKINS